MDEEKQENAVDKVTNAVDKVEDKKKEVEAAINVASKAAAGDYLGAAAEAIKSGLLKKMIKRNLIKYTIMLLIPIVIAAALFGVVNRMKEQMVNLISSAVSTTTGFFSKLWRNWTNDYWTDLEDTVQTYIIDKDTGKTVAYKKDGKTIIFHKEDLNELVLKKWPNGNKTVYDLSDSELESLTSEYLKGKNTQEKEFDLVDAYIKDLGDQGISIKDLRLLGDADYEDETKILEDADNKILVEKYISEFIRADYISQHLHKRRVDSEADKITVNPDNQFKIDGGIYLYRTNSKSTLELTPNNLEYNKYERIDGNEYTIMEYVYYEDFMQEINANNMAAKYHFTVDDDDNLVIAQIKTEYTDNTSMDPDSSWFEGLEDQPVVNATGEVKLEAKHIPYKEYIAKYAMPYEFLINLCQITQNPEYVYHVAMLARDTDIALVVQDEVEVDRVVTEIYTEESYYKNDTSTTPSTPTTSPSNRYKTRGTKLTTTEVPTLKIEYADAWNYYDEFEHFIKIKGTKNEIKGKDITDTGKNSNPVLPNLRNHHEEKKDSTTGEVTSPEYWDDTFITKILQGVQTINIKTTYEEKSTNSVTKSKQFLGLLRNDNGGCLEDCYLDAKAIKNNMYAYRNSDPEALNCAREVEFYKDGYNTLYTIPGMTKQEAPLNKLTSGLSMLYAIMQNNSSGYREGDKAFSSDKDLYDNYYSNAGVYNHDSKSVYAVKMQGIIEYLRKLHIEDLDLAPDNESYTKRQIGNWGNNGGGTQPGVTPGTPGEQPGQGGEAIIPDGSIPWKIWCALRNAGYSEYAAAGVLGNIENESAFSPSAQNGSSGAYGLAQWLGDRKTRLISYLGSDKTNADKQIQFMMGEINGDGSCGATPQSSGYPDQYQNWLNSTNPKDAATYFARWFERPGKTAAAVRKYRSAKRENSAQKWYDLFAGKPLDGGAPGGGGRSNS